MSTHSDDTAPEAPQPGMIVIYASQWCGFCRAAFRLLDNKGWDYGVIDVDADRAQRQAMQTLSGRRTVPQIFFGEHHVGGFDDMARLDADGELDALYRSL